MPDTKLDSLIDEVGGITAKAGRFFTLPILAYNRIFEEEQDGVKVMNFIQETLQGQRLMPNTLVTKVQQMMMQGWPDVVVSGFWGEGTTGKSTAGALGLLAMVNTFSDNPVPLGGPTDHEQAKKYKAIVEKTMEYTTVPPIRLMFAQMEPDDTDAKAFFEDKVFVRRSTKAFFEYAEEAIQKREVLGFRILIDNFDYYTPESEEYMRGLVAAASGWKKWASEMQGAGIHITLLTSSHKVAGSIRLWNGGKSALAGQPFSAPVDPTPVVHTSDLPVENADELFGPEVGPVYKALAAVYGGKPPTMHANKMGKAVDDGKPQELKTLLVDALIESIKGKMTDAEATEFQAQLDKR